MEEFESIPGPQKHEETLREIFRKPCFWGAILSLSNFQPGFVDSIELLQSCASIPNIWQRLRFWQVSAARRSACWRATDPTPLRWSRRYILRFLLLTGRVC